MSRDYIRETIETLVDEWVDEHTISPRDINTGDCAFFAMEVAQECPSVQIVETGNIPVEGEVTVVGVESPVHIWVTDGTYHYDAECPDGVRDWTELPFFKRNSDKI